VAAIRVVTYWYSASVLRQVIVATRLTDPVTAPANGTSSCPASSVPTATRLAGSTVSHR
jgi:hypothetical protein